MIEPTHRRTFIAGAFAFFFRRRVHCALCDRGLGARELNAMSKRNLDVHVDGRPVCDGCYLPRKDSK